MTDLTTRLVVAASSQGALSPADASLGDMLKGAAGATGQVLTKQSDGSAAFAATGGGGMAVGTFAISNLELMTSNSAPVTLVAAQPGFVLAPFFFAVTFSPGVTPFAGGAPPSLIYAGDAGGPILSIDASDPDSNQPFAGPNGQSMFTSIAMGVFNAQAVNTALQFETGSDLGDGTGTAIVTVAYLVIAAPTG